MKGKIKKAISVIISTIILLSSIGIAASVGYVSEIEVSISSFSDNSYELLLFIRYPDQVESFDFSMHFGSAISINNVETTNTDADSFSDNEDVFSETETTSENLSTEENVSEESTNPAQDENRTENVFIYDYEINNKDIKYSACFLDSHSTQDNFSFLRIELNADPLSSDTNFSLKYTIHSPSSSKSGFCTYSLTEMAPISNNIPKTFLLGDIDGNGKITASDARETLRFCVGLESIFPEKLPYANFDGNGVITAADARLILRASVGLETPTEHSFEISIADGKDCENAEFYIYKCYLTNISFSLPVSEKKHIASELTCADAVRCILCETTISPAPGHNFDTIGYCTRCKASEKELNEIKNLIIPLFEEITLYDTSASEAAENNNFSEYIKYIQKSTLIIKNIIEICDGITGLQSTSENMEKAYALRFNSFTDCMDNNGNISTNRRTYICISTAVFESNKYLDYAIYSIT